MKNGNTLQGSKREVMEYIDRYYNKHGYMPSYREIMAACHFKSTSSVCTYMNRLFLEGYLETDHPGAARAFRKPREGGNHQATV